MEHLTRNNHVLTSPVGRDPDEPAPQLPVALCSHIASKHGRYGPSAIFAPDHFLPDEAPDYQGTPQEIRRVVNAVWADHWFAHTKRNNPDHDHKGDEWWAFGKVAR